MFIEKGDFFLNFVIFLPKLLTILRYAIASCFQLKQLKVWH